METSKPKQLNVEELDTPANSLKFLEMYHKSAVHVEEAAASLKRVSYLFAVLAGFFFMVTGLNMMIPDKAGNNKPRLQ